MTKKGGQTPHLELPRPAAFIPFIRVDPRYISNGSIVGPWLVWDTGEVLIAWAYNVGSHPAPPSLVIGAGGTDNSAPVRSESQR